ncbi:type 1 fimbrial protein [Enterobacter ludwigii]|uniref:fimbrial protein n=1 Tax=Enterobacter ludwigii TaxID=299767 RepID=UPI00159C773B|nr:fimbrial protein [Enterobacter ludwigii]QLA06939.1 type 1 fimbrial protein [Enterobacter ludwigii]
MIFARFFKMTLAALLLFHSAQPYAVQDNLHYTGRLISIPCKIDTSNIEVSFDTIESSELYTNQRTENVPFSIILSGCNTTVSSLVNITFSGQETANPEGFLEVTGEASGIMIGMENAGGVLLPLNQPVGAQSIVTGSNTYDFFAFVQGKPANIQNKTIVPGNFNAVAMFVIQYQ